MAPKKKPDTQNEEAPVQWSRAWMSSSNLRSLICEMGFCSVPASRKCLSGLRGRALVRGPGPAEPLCPGKCSWARPTGLLSLPLLHTLLSTNPRLLTNTTTARKLRPRSQSRETLCGTGGNSAPGGDRPRREEPARAGQAAEPAAGRGAQRRPLGARPRRCPTAAGQPEERP